MIETVAKYALRGAAGFAVCGFLIAMAQAVFHSTSLLPFGVYILGGVVGAIALSRDAEFSTRRSAAFGFGFFLTGVLIAFAEFDTIGDDYGTAISGFAFAFAVGGGIGGLSFGPILMVAGALAFGIAGALWGLLWVLWDTFGVSLRLFSLNYTRIALTAFPFVLGGALFGAAGGWTRRDSIAERSAAGDRTWRSLVIVGGLIVVPLLLVAVLPWIGPREFYGKVTEVIDGDTIKVTRCWLPVRVELADIDCPEMGQPFGAQAREYISSWVLGRYVAVKGKAKDADGSLVANVIVLGGRRSLEIQLVSCGLAWCENSGHVGTRLKATEEGARKGKKGLWSQANPVPPWEYLNR